MYPTTHALTMNGRINTELKDPVHSPEAVIRQRLSLLDGRRRFALMLWAIPGGVALDEVDYGREPQQYIQAGGCRRRLSVEVRRVLVDGPSEYVVGRKTPFFDKEPLDQVIKLDEHQTAIRASEVFMADQAADIFIAYYATGWIPDSYTLRKLDL